MALATSAAVVAVNHHVNNTSAVHALPVTAVSQPPQPLKKRPNTGIKLPTTLSNLLHLHLSDHPNSAPLLTPSSIPKIPSWSPKEDISSFRNEIHGPADWSALLNPLHPYLRRQVIKYGELAQATYDAFDYNPFSKYCGSCLYGHHRLLSHLSLDPRLLSDQIPLRHLPHRPPIAGSSAPSTLTAGATSLTGWAMSPSAATRSHDASAAATSLLPGAEPSHHPSGCRLEPLGADHGDDRVPHGFLSLYTSKSSHSRYNKSSASEQLIEELKRLVTTYKEKGEDVSVTITGHSLGGALAVLSAYEAATELAGVPVSVISFGAPRVGNEAFAERLERLGVKALRVAVKQDVVPKMPGVLFNEGLSRVAGVLDWVYTHVGVELGLEVRASPYLKRAVDLVGFHSPETYLHLVDGYLSDGSGFRRESKRDPALVNKGCGLLREEMKVPAYWNQAANKGLVCNAYGRWVQPQRNSEDIPSPLRDAPIPGSELC